MMPLAQVFKSSPHRMFRGTIAAFDPGETTGSSIWQVDDNGPQLKHAKQLPTWPIEDAVHQFLQSLQLFKPTIAVFESYRVYNWKTDQHANSEVPTVQIIGSLKTCCILEGIPYTTQSAQIAKQFVTDDKLSEWGFWLKGEKHSRDSMRHAIYYILFGPKKS